LGRPAEEGWKRIDGRLDFCSAISMFRSRANCSVMMELPKNSWKSSGSGQDLAELALEGRVTEEAMTSGLAPDKTFAPES